MRGVDSDGKATGACGDVITSESALAALVEAAVGVEGERMRGEDRALVEEIKNLRIDVGHKF